MSLLRVQLWSCGGGRQSAGIAALIVQKLLPKPDHVAMVALEHEFHAVWPYINTYIRPALAALNIPFTAIHRKQYATVDMVGGEDGRSVLLPVHTNLSGKYSKLPEFCSNEWKRRVMTRWAAEQSDWKARGIDCWVGISWEERQRRRGPVRKWFNATYPLLDLRPTTVSGCASAVAAVGWPAAPRSRCAMCPNQSDTEWLELSPAELATAIRMEDELRAIDPHAFLHKRLIPLRKIAFDPADDNGGLFGGCSAGTCF